MRMSVLAPVVSLLFVASVCPVLAEDVTQQQVDGAYNVMRNFSLWFQEHFEDADARKVIVRDAGTFKSNFVIDPQLRRDISHWRRQLSRSDVRAIFPRRTLDALKSRLDELKDITEDDYFGNSDSEYRKARTNMRYTRNIVRSIVDNRILTHPSPTGVINDPNAPAKIEVAAVPSTWQPPSGLVDLPEVQQ